jgi:IS605 OrfB family transposase
MILAQALGVRLRPHCLPGEQRRRGDVHGEYDKIPGRCPVDFIVMEDLSRYRTNQGRSRQENSRLMKWCHGALIDKLKEMAEPFGIPVLEVPAQFSSRYDALTGHPGFRAVEVYPRDRERMPWRRILEKHANGESEASDPEPAFVSRVFERLDEINADRKDGHQLGLVVPRDGGPLFVAASGPTAAPRQADINAAVNIALRGVASPACLGAFPRTRCAKDKKGVLRPRSKDGNKREQVAFGVTDAVRSPREIQAEHGTVSLFHDPGGLASFETAEIDNPHLVGKRFATQKGLFTAVKFVRWDVCDRINGTRLAGPGDDDADDIPM